MIYIGSKIGSKLIIYGGSSKNREANAIIMSMYLFTFSIYNSYLTFILPYKEYTNCNVLVQMIQLIKIIDVTLQSHLTLMF